MIIMIMIWIMIVIMLLLMLMSMIMIIILITIMRRLTTGGAPGGVPANAGRCEGGRSLHTPPLSLSAEAGAMQNSGQLHKAPQSLPEVSVGQPSLKMVVLLESLYTSWVNGWMEMRHFVCYLVPRRIHLADSVLAQALLLLQS